MSTVAEVEIVADTTRELLEISGTHDGLVRPEDVVEYARDEDTALHSCFEWDDAVCGVQHRLWQARHIIRAAVTIVPNNGETECHVFVSLRDDRNSEGGYRETLAVMADEDFREKLLGEARAEMVGFIRKFELLQELDQVVTAMRKVF